MRSAFLLGTVAGALPSAHRLVHLLYEAENMPELSLENAWFIPEVSRRPIGVVTTWATVTAFALVWLAVWRVPALSSSWPALVAVASGRPRVVCSDHAPGSSSDRTEPHS